MTTLPPCPTCRRSKYRYGFSFFAAVSESVNLPALVAGVATGNVASIAVGGGGFFVGIFKGLGHAFDGVPSAPLLRCTHCRVFAILCPHCQTMQVLDAQPRTGDLVRCGSCQAAFGHDETGPAFDALVER